MEEELPEHRPPRRLKKRHLFGVLLLALLALVAYAWWKRSEIADGFIRDYLEKKGVRASYEIEHIGLREQRIRNLVVGDPNSPDLTVNRAVIDLSIGFGQPKLRELRLSGVRLKGRLAGGKLYLGDLDKLRDMESKEPISLPDINLKLSDAILSLRAPWGGVGIAVDGGGNLRNRFDGRLLARSKKLASGGCVASAIRYDGRLRIRNVRPEFTGPLAAASASCGTPQFALASPLVDGKVQFTEAFDRWVGDVAIGARSAILGKRSVDNIGGKLSFSGSQQRTEYKLALSEAALRMPELTAAKFAADAEGTISSTDAGLAITARGDANLSRATLPTLTLPSMQQLVRGTKSTPIGPVVGRLVPALGGLARAFDSTANFDIAITPDQNSISVDSLFMRSDSGVIFRQLAPLSLVDGRLQGPVRLSTAGGDLPSGNLSLRPQGGGWAGTLTLQPYSAPGGSISIPTLAFEGGGRRPWRFRGNATMTGPLLGGTVTGLSLPVDGAYSDTGFTMNSACTNVRYGGLATGTLRLPAGFLRACPQRGSILSVANGETRFALTIPSLAVAGSLGSTPLKASGSSITFDLDSGFGANNIAVDLGRGESVSNFTVARLDGMLAGPGVKGTIRGGAGQIANVPLLISEAEGQWRWQGSTLGLDSRLFVSDAAEQDRFNRLDVPDFQLTLSDSMISAIGALVEPETSTKVADVQIMHNLASSIGNALLSIDQLRFGQKLQPDQITPLTLGHIANVQGRLSGDGRIEWNGNGVKSTGRFSITPTNLDAAFGPVDGLQTEIIFTDLLGMVTEPNQIARVRTLNPGIPAMDGVIRYQLLADQRVRIEEGRWPFHGGELILEPTIIDFDVEAKRELTFRLIGLDAEKFLAEYDLQNIRVSGVFDGTLPMVFDQEGGRIVGGWLVSRSGGGELSYLGELSYKDMGLMANFAFEALRSIRFDEMQIGVDGNLGGELITEVRFRGLQQGSLARRNYITRQLAKLPIEFNVRIQAEFLSLIGNIRSIYDGDYAAQRFKGLVETPDPVPGEGPEQP
jgi:hypothetical protein